MELLIELTVNDYYQLREKCRSLGPSYTILQGAILRQDSNGSGDRFAIQCTMREAGALLEVARQYSLTAAIYIESAIRKTL